MRVNDLAKQLGVKNNELISVMNEMGIDVTSHMSGVSEDNVKAVIKKYENISAEDLSEEKQEKKKKFTVVFRPQNAKQENTKKILNDVENKKEEQERQKKLEIEKQKQEEIEKEKRRLEQLKAEEERKIRESLEKKEKEIKESNKETKEMVNVSNVKDDRTQQSSSQFQKNEDRYDKKNHSHVNADRDKNDRNNRNERNDRSFKSDRNDRYDRNNRNDRSFKSDRNDRNNRSDNDNGYKRYPNNGNQNRFDNKNGDRNFANKNNQRNDYRRDKFTPKENPFEGKDDDTPTNKFKPKQKPKASSAVMMDKGINKKNPPSRLNKNNYKNQKDEKRNINEDGPSKNVKISKHAFIKPEKKEEVVEDIKEIILPERLTIKELASKLKLQPSSIVKKLFLEGKIVNLNTDISYEEAEDIAIKYDVLCTPEEKIDVIEELLKESEESEDTMVRRPPVVCVMGHVDHGKTSLLDAIRKTNVTTGEAGGITQHIGAYTVNINKEPITFLDTPGHEAFTAMRMRGAKSTDIAVLVVAADDGVKPQTIEAINHAKAAEVEIIVAINKIDKPAANIEKVKQELSEHEIISEDWGGSTIFCPVSAKSGEGIDNLLEMILLAAEVKELKANPNRKARGLVIEAELDKGKGPIATILVQKGTLKVGDFVAAGSCSGKVRAMINDKGVRVKEAGPSTPVEILGLDGVPNAGEVLVATENDKDAKSFAATFKSENKKQLVESTKQKLNLDTLFVQIQAGNIKELPIVVKADVQGSVEAVKQSLLKLSNEEVAVKVIHSGVGAINESDVSLASASNAIIIGFNVKPDATAKSIVDREEVDLRLYKVIYKAIEDIEIALNGMLEPVYEEKVLGHAEIRQLFKASGVGTIAGSYVLDGKFVRGCKVRITREGEQIYEGALASLKRFKDDVKEVNTGYECGLVFEKFNDFNELDIVEAYDMVEVPRN